MKAIRFHNNGGPDVLSYEDIPIPKPSKGEVLVNLKAAGVNFIDIYQREGLYPIPLPVTAGLEGAGIVTAIGREVTEVKIGDNVAYTGCLGSYAEYAVVPPILFVFSTTNTSNPIKDEVSAAVIPADPEPRTRMSTLDGNCNSASFFKTLIFLKLIYLLLRVLIETCRVVTSQRYDRINSDT